VEFTSQYAASRKLKDNHGNISRHIQLETGMSITGSNADERFPIKPSEERALLEALLSAVAGKNTGTTSLSAPIAGISGELLSKKGKSLVISGSNDTEIQLLVNQINYALENYGHTIDITRPVYLRKGIDAEMVTLVEEMNAGAIGALLIVNTNPVYHYPDAEKFIAGMQHDLTVSLAVAADDFSHCTFICPPAITSVGRCRTGQRPFRIAATPY
jgi:molybdopterin-containing oxidoreductase family iron-sulfur binding subunit